MPAHLHSAKKRARCTIPSPSPMIGCMGLLADIYVSRDEEAVGYDAAPESFPDRLQYKSLTDLELSTLWALMRGVKWEVSLMGEFACLLVKDGGERLIHKLPSTMVRDLGVLTPEQVAALAAKWASTDELACKPAEVQPIIEGLVLLAQKASASDRNIYIWNCV